LKQEWQKSRLGAGKQTAKTWFSLKIERKLAKLSKTTFTYRSSSLLFYDLDASSCETNYSVIEYFVEISPV
jgi:hypothetical protein